MNDGQTQEMAMDRESLDTSLRNRERGSSRREAGCVPAKITKVNGKTVNVTQLIDAITYGEEGKREDVSPLDYEDVKFGPFGGEGIIISIEPKVGMRGIMFVTDYDVADIDAGKVSQDRIRGRSSGYFIPMLESEYLEGIVLQNESGGKITLLKDSATFEGTEGGPGKLSLTSSGGDLLFATSVVDAIKEMNEFWKATHNLSSPSAEGLTK